MNGRAGAGVRVAALAIAVTLVSEAHAETQPSTGSLRVLSLDQCADQYALALASDATLALSPRADDPDAWLRAHAPGHLQVRPTLEAAVAFRPDVVVRYWGGDPRLVSSLRARGVRVVEIADATDIAGVRRNIRAVAAGLDQSARGEAMVARMDRRLAAVSRPDKPDPALYLTAGGFTAGQGTLIDAMLRAAGLRNLADRPGYGAVSVERIALDRPIRFVLGFFDQVRADWRGPGRHPVVRRAATGRTAARLPAAVLTCPAWFVADGVETIAGSRR